MKFKYKSGPRRRYGIVCFLLLSGLARGWLGADSGFKLSGDYLLYSFDFNYIYGHGNLVIESENVTIGADRMHIDIGRRIAMFSGNCTLEQGKKKTSMHLITVELESMAFQTVAYADTVVAKSIMGRRVGADKRVEEISPPQPFAPKNLDQLQKSLVYFIGRRIDIRENFEVTGFGVTIFLEGMQSVAFKKFRMNKGSIDTGALFYLNKIWYYNSTGLVADFMLNLEKQIKKTNLSSQSHFKINYDLFNTRYVGSKWDFYLQSTNRATLSDKTSLNLEASYISENMAGSKASIRTTIFKRLQSDIALEYRKSFNNPQELWLRSKNNLNLDKLGRLNVNLNYQNREQYNGEVAYSNSTLKNLSFNLQHSISKLRLSETTGNRLTSSQFSLEYSSKAFNLSTQYALNTDLLNNQRQSNPQINLNISPFTLYSGLLRLNLFSSININNLRMAHMKDYSFKTNTGLNLASDTLEITKGTSLNFQLRLEQFIDRDATNNYTSSGLIIKTQQKLFTFADLELLYNYQSRWLSRNWLIQGTTSQDLTGIFKLRGDPEKVNLWFSLSYNSKMGEFTTGYLDFKFKIIKHWHFQSLLNYDFEFNRLNYELFLFRKAGRLTMRLTYRSLSKQILFEILPGG